MTLATHGVIGAVLAQKIFPGHPWLGFLAGVASHYALDALPHWDYTLRSRKYERDPLKGSLEIGRNFLFDLVFIGADFALGVALVYIFLTRGGGDWSVAAFGLLGGVLPDFLQFMYYMLKREPFTFLQRVHSRAHYPVRWQRNKWLGIALQAALIAAVLKFLA